VDCAFTRVEVAAYTARQLNALFPDPRPVGAGDLAAGVDDALERLERCFRQIALPAYGEPGAARFDLYHTDQYSTYLAYLGNALWEAGADRSILGRVFALNRALHGLNCLYDTRLPEAILLIHAVGAVLGRTHYPNFIVVTQGCTIGAVGGAFPDLSPGLIMSAGSSIIGPGTIGANVMLEPHVHVLKSDVPPNVRVAGPAPHRFIPHTDRALRHYFHSPDA
jgi:serine O-acetyltransferase